MYQLLSCIFLIILLIPCAWATDIKLNVINNTDVQDIHEQPHHDGQYNLALSPELWQKVPLKILLKNNDTVLASIMRSAIDEPLTIYALDEKLIPAQPRTFKLPPKPIHIHLHATANVEYGALMVSTAGRLSIYPAAYDNLQVQARRIYLNKDPKQENKALAIKGNLHLIADRTIHLRLPLNVKGSLIFSTTKLKAVGSVKGHGRAIIAADKIEQHAPMVAKRSIAVVGKHNGAFKECSLNNKLASEGEVLVRGAKFTLSEQGQTFSKTETTIEVDTLKVHGQMTAPFLRIIKARLAHFEKARILANSLSLHAQHMIFAGTTIFHAKLGMWIKGRSAQGFGQFLVDSKASWQIPLPKREENQAKLRVNNANVIEGMYWDVKSINLEPNSKFKVASKAIIVDSIFTKIAGSIKRGSYNKFPLSLNAKKYFSLKGSVDTFSAHLSGMEGIISGNFTTGKLNTSVGDLNILGNLTATHLTTQGENLTISASGCISCEKHDFFLNEFLVNGIWNSNIVLGRSGQLHVNDQGLANLKQAKLDIGSLAVLGTMKVDSLDLLGHSMSILPSGQLNLGSLNLNCASVNLSGNFSAQQTNICGGDLSASGPISMGKAHLFGNKFISSGPVFMDKAHISYHSLSTSGQLTIGDGKINVTTWSHAPNSELSGRLYVDIDHAAIGGKISGSLVKGEIKHLWLAPTGYIASDTTNLYGQDFNSQGSINSPDGIKLDYLKYASLGGLSTAKELDLRMNDRFINQHLLKAFEQQFTFGGLSISTDQFLLFYEDFYFGRGLALSASGLGLSGHKPYGRANFQVNGPLMLDAQKTDLNVSNYEVMAWSLTSHSARNTIVHNSKIVTSANQSIKADQDVMVTPLVTHHKTVEKKSSNLGLKIKKIIHEWNTVDSSEFLAGGYIFIDGANALFDSARFLSSHGNYIKTTGNITSPEQRLYDLLIIRKKFIPISQSSSQTRQAFNSPTIIRDADEVVLDSGGKIRLSNTIIASKNVVVTGKQGVYACLPTGIVEHSKKSWRAFVCHSLSGISKEPLNTLLNFDPLVASINNVFTSANHPVNAMNAMILAGIQAYNFWNGLSLKDRLLGNLATFHVGISSYDSEFFETRPGLGGIFATKTATIASSEGNIETKNGFLITAKNVNIKCRQGEWIKEGFKKTIKMSTSRNSLSMGFNALSMNLTDVGVDTLTRDYEYTKWLPQITACDGLSVEAKNIVNLDGHETIKESREGFGLNIGPKGGSGYVITDDIHVAVSYSSPQSKALGFFGLSINGYNFTVPLAPSPSNDSRRETKDAFSSASADDDDQPSVLQNHVNDGQEKIYAANGEQPPARKRKYALAKARVNPAHVNFAHALTTDEKNKNKHQRHNTNPPNRRGYAKDVKNAVLFSKDAAILALATADEMINNFFGFSTDDYGNKVPSLKDSSHYHDAKKAMGKRKDGFLDVVRQAIFFASHFSPKWRDVSSPKITPGDVINLYQTLRGTPKDLLLAKNLRAIIESDYLDPLQRLSEDITAGVKISKAQLDYGFDLAKNYYSFLKSCEVPYGAMALDIVNGRGLIGQLTDVNFMRQCEFAGVPNCRQAQRMVAILLAQQDASLRIDQAVSAQTIAAYHIKVYESLDLPVYAWSGLFLATAPGAWQIAMGEKNMGGAQISEVFHLAKNLFADQVDDLSVPRMLGAFFDALTCTNLPKLCPDTFSVTDYSFASDPYEELANKWDVKKQQIQKVKLDTLPFNNTGKRFINNFRYKIVPIHK